jgi:hypothetical protein
MSIFQRYALVYLQKVNVVPLKRDKHVIQLEKTQVKVTRELKYVMIRIVTHPKFVQVIDIIVIDIPEAYGLLLNRDWSEKLNGYFSTDWAHLWLPLKGYKNMIRIDRERYVKHTITDLETLNEPSSTEFPMLGNYSCDSYFRNFFPFLSDIPLTKKYEMVFQEKSLIPTEETLSFQDLSLERLEIAVGKEEGNRKREANIPCPKCWILYFDGSKSKQG